MSSLTIQTLDTRIIEMLKTELSSLCNTCDHFNACAYQDLQKGVQQCELFENESGTFKSISSNNREIKKFVPPAGIKGICLNCDRVWNCKLPKAPEGIWHCEEYE